MMISSPLHTILHYIRLCWNFVTSLFSHDGSGGGDGGIVLSLIRRASPRSLLTFDDGTKVEVGRQIAEGGFSYVFEAFPVCNGTKNGANSRTGRTQPGYSVAKYALKRINCSDRDIVRACRKEAGVHRTLPSQHPNLMELLGLTFVDARNQSGRSNGEHDTCYMLFPYLPRSLREEIGERRLLPGGRDGAGAGRRRRPFTTREVLRLFGGLVDALAAMHAANLSHRDVKPENVLLRDGREGAAAVPVLMDFGSAGPLAIRLGSRREVLAAVEDAAAQTTLPYRPPELCEGGVRHGPREMLDYGKVDAWSLGCVLFALMHGASPFETEFLRSDPSNISENQFGLVRVVECTHLKILQEVPFPPWIGSGLLGTNSDCTGDGRNGKYPIELYKFIQYMVHHDRHTRPNIHEVARRFDEIHLELLSGERWVPYDERRWSGRDKDGKIEYDDFDSLIASRDFV